MIGPYIRFRLTLMDPLSIPHNPIMAVALEKGVDINPIMAVALEKGVDIT